MFAALMGIVAGLASPTSLSGHAGAAVGDKVFVCGGMGLANEGHFSSEAWMVDPAKGKWSPLPPPKTARGMAAAAKLDDSIYVAGGLAWGDETLASVERLNLTTLKWSDVAPLKVPRSRLALVAVGGKLYAVSGMRGVRKGSEAINTPSIEAYDPARNSWNEAGRLNHARHGFAASVWEGRIYVFGGNDEDTRQSAEVWDPATGRADELPPMPAPRGFEGLAEHEGKMILFGGRSMTDHPSAFDLHTRKWSTLAIPDVDLSRSVSNSVGNTLWTVGGESRKGNSILQSFDLSAWAK